MPIARRARVMPWRSVCAMDFAVAFLVVSMPIMISACSCSEQNGKEHSRALSNSNNSKEDPDLLFPSCTNHICQLMAILRGLKESGPPLPDAASARLAFELLGGDMEWLRGGGAACPEAFERSGDMGYVYVGGGITMRQLINRRPLILFCPKESHEG